KWRRWQYARHWDAVMSVARLAVAHRGRVVVPVLDKVTSTGCTDLVRVRLVSGQCPADYASRTDNLAHGFGAFLCRGRTARPPAPPGGPRTALAPPHPRAATPPPSPPPAMADLRALPVGRREDGTIWSVRLHGTHLLIAGSTGAGKGSILWGLVRALLGHLQA